MNNKTGFKICGVQLSSVRAAVAFESILQAKGLLIYEQLPKYPWNGKTLKESTAKEVAAVLTLAELKKLRNCGNRTIAEITSAMVKAKARPSWAWPEEKKLPSWVIQKCPCCGKSLYAK